MAMLHRAHEMVQRAALAAAPGDPAIIGFNGEKVSYADLMQKSLCLADAVAAHKGGNANALVGIFQERSVSFFASVVGILSAGCCYVPVSTKYGNDRIEYILSFAKPVVVLANIMYSEQLKEMKISALNIDGVDYSVKRDIAAPALGDASGCDLAYVIFTSGTTGRPKGVMVEHRSLCNMMREKHASYAMATSDKLLQFYDVAFDGSIIDYMPTLSCGASLVLWKGDLEMALKVSTPVSGAANHLWDPSPSLLPCYPSCLACSSRCVGQPTPRVPQAASTHGATHTMLTTSAMALFPCAAHG